MEVISYEEPRSWDDFGMDITVSYVNHVKGDETTKAYLGEVAIWR